MAQTLQSLYSIPAIVPQLGLSNSFTAVNTFTAGLIAQGTSTISSYGTPYQLPDPGSTTGNWYILGTVTFTGGSGSTARIEINGSTSYSTGAFIAGQDVIDLRMGNNTGTSTAPNVTGNYYRIGDQGTSGIVNGTLKLVSVNLSVTDNQYQIWYQSNIFTRYSRVYFYSSDATFAYSGAYQSTGDPSNTVASPNLYVYVVPRTVAFGATTISAKGRLLVNSPTDDGTSALLVNGTSTLGVTNITGALNVSANTILTTPATEYDLFFRTSNSPANQVYLALNATNFAIAYTDASGNYAGQALYANRTSGAVTISTGLTVLAPSVGSALTVGSSSATTALYILLNTAAGYNRGIAFQSGAVNRWVIATTNTSESGSNAGSDFQINRFSDAGSYIDSPFQIVRQTGVIFLSQYFSMANGQTLASWAGGGYINSGPGGGTVQIGSSGGSCLSLGVGPIGSYTQKWACDSSGNIVQSGSLTVNYASSGNGTILNSAGSAAGVVVQDTGGNGANIKFVGNGSTTPNKTIRTVNGHFAIVNSAYNAEIFTVDDTGNNWHAGEVQSATANGFRIVGGSVGVFWRFDGATMYLMKTASGSPLANWDGTRPFAWNISGGITSDQTWTISNSVFGNSFTLNNTSCTMYTDGGTNPDLVLRSGTGGTVYYAVFNPSGNNGGLAITANVTAANFVINSDERLKTGDRNLDGSQMLQGLMQLEPKWYLKEGKAEYGFFAQHVLGKTMFKDAVTISYDKYNHPDIPDLHQLNLQMLIAPIVSASQQIYREVQELRLQVETQAMRIQELESRL